MSENNPQQPEKKIVLRSAGDQGVNPADQTQKAGMIKLTISDPMKMRETDSSNMRRMTPPGQIADPMEMRHTDTGNLKRLRAQDASGGDDSAAQKARRTIKLKPVAAELAAPAAPVAPDEDDEDKEQTVELQRSDLDLDNLEGEAEEEEAPTVKIAKATAAEAEAEPREDAPTVKISRASAMAHPPMPSPVSDSLPPPPSSAVPGAKQTIKLRPASGDSSASSAPTVIKPSSAATLKLKPVSATSSAPPPAPAASSMGGTMKLKPISAPEGAAEDDSDTMAVAKKPFKLVTTTRAPAEGAAAPSDPTLKLDPATSLEDAVPGDTPTLRLGLSNAPPAAPQSSPTKPTLRLKSSTVPHSEDGGVVAGGDSDLPPSLQEPASAVEAKARRAKKPAKPLSAEPSALFVLASALTVVFLVVYIGIAVAQFGSMKLGLDVRVPGLSGAYAPVPEEP